MNLYAYKYILCYVISVFKNPHGKISNFPQTPQGISFPRNPWTKVLNCLLASGLISYLPDESLES